MSSFLKAITSCFSLYVLQVQQKTEAFCHLIDAVVISSLQECQVLVEVFSENTFTREFKGTHIECYIQFDAIIISKFSHMYMCPYNVLDQMNYRNN